MGDCSANKEKTLFISDLDGTLLDPSACLSKYTVGALNTMISGGLHFTIATARTIATCKKILAPLALNLPVILMNGVAICDMANGKCLQVNTMLPESIKAVVKILNDFNATGFMYEQKDDVLSVYHEELSSAHLQKFVVERVARYNKSFTQVKDFGLVPPDNIIYFTLLDSREVLQPIYEEMKRLADLNASFYYDVYNPELWYLEIASAKASKKNAVNYMRDAYGYERIFCFGDNLNDLPMFEACDIKIAMENARDEVKKAADHICGPNTDDGVAKWLDENAKS